MMLAWILGVCSSSKFDYFVGLSMRYTYGNLHNDTNGNRCKLDMYIYLSKYQYCQHCGIR